MPGRLLVIPEDYDGARGVEPIVLEIDQTEDPRRIIDYVAPYHSRLCSIAVRYLHDVHRVSDLTQAALRRVENRSNGELIGQNILIKAGDIARNWRKVAIQQAVFHRQCDQEAALQLHRKEEKDYAEILHMQRLVEAMRAIMDDEQRHVLNLFLDGLNYQEIADLIGVGKWTTRLAVRRLILSTAKRASDRIAWTKRASSNSSEGPGSYGKPSSPPTRTRKESAARQAAG
jgi:DNA-directed RNA polymerase specialized sigma24 family protein